MVDADVFLTDLRRLLSRQRNDPLAFLGSLWPRRHGAKPGDFLSPRKIMLNRIEKWVTGDLVREETVQEARILVHDSDEQMFCLDFLRDRSRGDPICRTHDSACLGRQPFEHFRHRLSLQPTAFTHGCSLIATPALPPKG